MKIKRVVEYIREFPGLGEKIRLAREQDGRPLTQICRACGLSRSYWYQLEAEDMRASATEEVIRKIEKALNVDLGVCFDD